MTRAFVGTSRRLAIRGIAGIAFGVLTLLWPHVTLSVLVALWGAFALVDGAIALSAAIGDRLLRHRGWVALWGLSGITAGIVTFVWPGITALALLFVIAAWCFVAGTSLIAISISERNRLTGEWLIGLTGFLSVLLGTMLVITPGEGALTITWVIGWWACLYGGLSLSLAWIARQEAGNPATRPEIRLSGPEHAAA